MTIPGISSQLSLDHLGIWRAPESGEALRYPASGNASCQPIEERSYWFRHRNECIVSLVRQFPPRGPIFDIGGGNGFVTRALIEAGFESVLVEPGPAGARHAKLEYGIPNVICASLEGAGFEASSLPAVGLFDVLEHMEHPSDVVAKLARALAPEGLFFGTVPAHPWLWSGADAFAQHHRRYTAASLREVLRHEFDVLFLTSIFRALTLPILMLRAVPFRLGLGPANAGVLRGSAEHGTRGGLGARIVTRLLAGELESLKQRKAATWGASLLFVARRKS